MQISEHPPRSSLFFIKAFFIIDPTDAPELELFSGEFA